MKTLLLIGTGVAIVWLVGWARRRDFLDWIQAGERAIEANAPEIKDHGEALPPIVLSYLQKVAPGVKPGAHHVRFHQAGFMALQTGPADKSFTAQQIISIGRPEFSWAASVSILPLVKVEVCDRLVGREGTLEARLGGVVTIARESGADLLKGELLRYLAELPWAPWGFLHLRNTIWKEVGPRLWQLTLTHEGTSVSIFYQFGDNDLITSIRVDDRPRTIDGGRSMPTVWLGDFANYTDHEGVLLPEVAEVSWLLDGQQKFTYFKAHIDHYEILP